MLRMQRNLDFWRSLVAFHPQAKGAGLDEVSGVFGKPSTVYDVHGRSASGLQIVVGINRNRIIVGMVHSPLSGITAQAEKALIYELSNNGT